MPASPVISVVMPFYNSERTVARAVRSILRQSFADFELIAIDDGSSDDGYRVVSGIRDPRIRLHRNERNLGVSATRNAGLDLMRGAFMAPMDADDVCRRDRLSLTLAAMRRNPSLGLCGGWARVVGRSWPGILMRQPCGPSAVRAFFLFGMPFFNDALLFRAEILRSRGLRFPIGIDAGEDYDLTRRCAEAFPVDNVPAVVLDYQFSPQGISATQGGRATAGRLTALRGELAALTGGAVPEADLRYHAGIGNGMGASDPGDLRRRERWLQSLLDANTRNPRFDGAGMLAAVGLVWFRICRNSAHLGRFAWEAWSLSPWSAHYRPLREERLSFLGSWMLAKTLPGRGAPQGALGGL